MVTKKLIALKPRGGMNKDLGIDRLLGITEGCRPDMHEPDEQGVKARIVGDHLDNAFGAHIAPELITKGGQEYVVILERFDGETIRYEAFNLANLIAAADDRSYRGVAHEARLRKKPPRALSGRVSRQLIDPRRAAISRVTF